MSSIVSSGPLVVRDLASLPIDRLLWFDLLTGVVAEPPVGPGWQMSIESFGTPQVLVLAEHPDQRARFARALT